jgi:phenylpropionate dioxygenase-like ring-hydroxylating dioxygenase large terminal subunit
MLTMTQTIMRPGFGSPSQGVSAEGYEPNGGQVPRLSGDIRHLVPKLGLREYWYPLCGLNRVKKSKPLRVRMLGEDLCVFRSATKGEVYALTDICPHRGARLSEGDCHYEGTVACPYHGWVFDGEGKNLAVLSEGPNSAVCGKPGTEARSFPTRVLKGIVWVWMGSDAPAPMEEDVPEEFFNPKARIFFNDRIYWRTNWEVALENSMDSHVQYLHRDNLQALISAPQVRSGGSTGQRPNFVGNGFTNGTRPAPATDANGKPHLHDVYPQGWKWPKARNRRYVAWFFGPLLNLLKVPSPGLDNPYWGTGHHLPGMFRSAQGSPPGAKKPGFFRRTFGARGGAGLYGQYTRQTVPVDEWLTRVWYHHWTMPRNSLQHAWYWFLYWTWGRWVSEYNFSQQDMSVMLNQAYDAPEKLSGTDAEVVQWRRLVVTKHFGGRNHPFEYENPDAVVAEIAASMQQV